MKVWNAKMTAKHTKFSLYNLWSYTTQHRREFRFTYPHTTCNFHTFSEYPAHTFWHLHVNKHWIHRLFITGNTTKCKCNINFTTDVSFHISNLELQSKVYELMLICDIVLTCSARHEYKRCALWSFTDSEELTTFSWAQHKETVLLNDNMVFVSQKVKQCEQQVTSSGSDMWY